MQNMQRRTGFLDALTAGFQPAKWEVWFAWFPVRITVVTNITEIHDEVTVESYTRWRWLTCVARRGPLNRVGIRTRNGFRMLAHWYGIFPMYAYGPATNALSQPRTGYGL